MGHSKDFLPYPPPSPCSTSGYRTGTAPGQGHTGNWRCTSFPRSGDCPRPGKRPLQIISYGTHGESNDNSAMMMMMMVMNNSAMNNIIMNIISAMNNIIMNNSAMNE